jgi:hypothetical protein
MVRNISQRISVGDIGALESDIGQILSCFVVKISILPKIEAIEMANIFATENIVLASEIAEPEYSGNLHLQFINLVGQLFEQVSLKLDFEVPGLTARDFTFWLAKENSLAELKNPVFNELRLLLELKRRLFHFAIKIRLILSKIAKIDSETLPAEFANIQRHISDYETRKNLIKKSEVRYWNLIAAFKSPKTDSQKTTMVSKKVKKLSSVRKSSRSSPDNQERNPGSNERPRTVGIDAYLSIRPTRNTPSKLQQHGKLFNFNLLGGFDKIQRDDSCQKRQNLDAYLKPPAINLDVELPLRHFSRPDKKVKAAKKFKFMRFEQFDKKCTEYKGSLVRHNSKIDARNPYRKYSGINYDLDSDDELSLLNAENCSVSREENESEDDTPENPEDKAFIVDDDYISDDEGKQSQPRTKARKLASVVTELKPSLLTAESIRNDVELFQRLAVINLTNLNFPIKTNI